MKFEYTARVCATPFQPYAPVAFTDSVSYLEQCYRLQREVNEFIAWVNKVFDESDFVVGSELGSAVNGLLELIQEADDQITKLRSDYDAFVGQTEKSFDDLLADYANVLARVAELSKQQRDNRQELLDLIDQKSEYAESLFLNLTDDIIQIEADVQAVKNAMSDLQSDEALFEADLNVRFDELKAQCFQMIEDLTAVKNGNRIEVTNPATGKNDTLRHTLIDIYNALVGWGLTATEYDGMKLTAAEYDGKELSASEYDHFGKWIFFREVELSWVSETFARLDETIAGIEGRLSSLAYMRSPLTGAPAHIHSLINILFGNLSARLGGLTAKEYDEKELTAENYDGKKITAYYYNYGLFPE